MLYRYIWINELICYTCFYWRSWFWSFDYCYFFFICIWLRSIVELAVWWSVWSFPDVVISYNLITFAMSFNAQRSAICPEMLSPFVPDALENHNLSLLFQSRINNSYSTCAYSKNSFFGVLKMWNRQVTATNLDITS